MGQSPLRCLVPAPQGMEHMGTSSRGRGRGAAPTALPQEPGFYWLTLSSPTRPD